MGASSVTHRRAYLLTGLSMMMPTPNARHHPRPHSTCIRGGVVGRRVRAVVRPPVGVTRSCWQLRAGAPHPEVLFREPSGGVGKARVWPPFLNQVLPRRTIARRVLDRRGAHPVRTRPVDLPVVNEYAGDPTNAGRVADQ